MDEQGERKVLEDINITSFFSRHADHMPTSFHLHAEIDETDENIILFLEHPGLEESEVKVDCKPNTIKVNLCFEGDSEDCFSNTYITPSPIDEKNVEVKIDGGKLTVTAKKRLE